MRIKARYSHLNGEQYLLVHHPNLWRDVREVIANVDAGSCRTKESREKVQVGRLLFSPVEMNLAFKRGLQSLG